MYKLIIVEAVAFCKNNQAYMVVVFQLSPDTTPFNHITYVPGSFPASPYSVIRSYVMDVKMVGAPIQLSDQVFSSGEVGDGIRKQALILNTAKGLVVITGCAHPGVVKVVTRAQQHLKRDVYLAMGGFHRKGMSASEIQGIIIMLQEMGVKRLPPATVRERWPWLFFDRSRAMFSSQGAWERLLRHLQRKLSSTNLVLAKHDHSCAYIIFLRKFP